MQLSLLVAFLVATSCQLFTEARDDFNSHTSVLNRHAVGVVFRQKNAFTPVDARATLVFEIRLPSRPRVKQFIVDCEYLKRHWTQRHHHNIRVWEQKMDELRRKQRRTSSRETGEHNSSTPLATASPLALLMKPNALEHNATCDILSIIQRSIVNDQQQLHGAFNEILSDIMSISHNLLNRDPSQSRRKRQGMLSLGAHLIGLANVYDIWKLQSAVNTLAKTQDRQFAATKLHWDHVLSLMKITDARISNINQQLRGHDLILDQMHVQFVQNLELLEYVVIYLTKYIEHQQNATKLLLDLSVFRDSINELLFGKLDPLLIRRSDIRANLLELDNYLIAERSPYYIIQQNLQYYYKHASFFTWTASDSLFIALQTPLSIVVNPLFLYTMELIPMPLHSADDAAAYMQLDLSYKAIAFNFEDDKYLLFDQMDELPNTEEFEVAKSNVKWRHRTNDSCVWSLLENKPSQIKNFCDYTVFKAPLPSNIYKITHNMLLIHKINRTLLICDDNETEVENTFAVHVQQINCYCQLKIDRFYFPSLFDDCHKSNVSHIFLHTVNLRLLWEYFTEEELNLLDPSSILNHTVEIHLPELMFSSQYSDSLFAIEETLRYKFDNVMNVTKTDKGRLTSIQNYLHKRLAQLEMASDTFDWFNYWHLIQLVGVCAAGAAFIVSLYLFCRLRTLSAALLMVGRTQAIPVLLRYTTPVSPVSVMENSTAFYLEWLNAFRTFVAEEDLLLVLIILLIIIMFLKLIIKMRKRMKYDVAYLVLDNGQEQLFFPLATFKFSADFYAISIQALQSKISLQGFCGMTVKLHINDFALYQKVQDYKLHLQTVWHILPHTAWKCRNILRQSHSILLAIIDSTGKTLELLKLANWEQEILAAAYFQDSQTRLVPSTHQASAPPVYPVLSLE